MRCSQIAATIKEYDNETGESVYSGDFSAEKYRGTYLSNLQAIEPYAAKHPSLWGTTIKDISEASL
jgi:hypothetical protein